MRSATKGETGDMMKLLNAIVSALKSGLMAIGRAATWPLRALIGGGGGGMPAPQAVAEDGASDPAAERERAMALGNELAAIVLGYAADSVIDDAPAPMPETLPPELRAWVRGLSREECQTLLQSDLRGVSAHIQGVFALQGVRKVQPLPTADWSRAVSRDHDFEPDLSAAATLSL
jgi:hypothetical protein